MVVLIFKRRKRVRPRRVRPLSPEKQKMGVSHFFKWDTHLFGLLQRVVAIVQLLHLRVLPGVFDGTMTFVCIFTMICESSGKVVGLGEPLPETRGTGGVWIW